MSALAQRLDWAPARLAELLARYHIPGGALGVWLDGEQFTTAAGQANVAAEIAATPETLWLIGSITKVFTTTLIMQLVERGEVMLDAPVVAYLSELRLADADATETVTVRQLLTHTSGITGDYFPDTGRGDDAVARCVASLAEVDMLSRPGAMFSYCNSGFILAGGLLERLTGGTWDAALWSRLLQPLGVTHFATLPEEALRFRVGVAHAPQRPDGELRPGEMWPEVRSGGPAGFTPYANVAELLCFARLHLDGGRTPSGARLLSSDSVDAMQAREVDSNPSGGFDSDGWGLGWARFRYGTHERVIGHNGGSSAVLRVLPERNCAIASLTNASGGALVGHHIIDAIVDDLFGLRIPSAPPAAPSATPRDLTPYDGRYRHYTYEHRVSVSDNANQLLVHSDDDTPPITLTPFDARTFTAHMPGYDVPGKAAFLEPDAAGRPKYLHLSGRACVREG
jgi:CubicO group peptidase (beta-lactamase class C family)